MGKKYLHGSGSHMKNIQQAGQPCFDITMFSKLSVHYCDESQVHSRILNLGCLDRKLLESSRKV